MLSNVFQKIVTFTKQCEKKCFRAGQATDDNMAHARCMLYN